jgi:capsid protein
MMVPTLCGGVARWFLEAWALITPRDRAEILAALVSHTPPARIPIEPLKEAKAAEAEVRAGFRSRSDVVRSLGRDPAAVRREIEADNAADKAAGALFTTTTAAPVAPVAA